MATFAMASNTVWLVTAQAQASQIVRWTCLIATARHKFAINVLPTKTAHNPIWATVTLDAVVARNVFQLPIVRAPMAHYAGGHRAACYNQTATTIARHWGLVGAKANREHYAMKAVRFVWTV
jgi:hypothetical protein